ncbi:hypothetical protein B0H10DRAFT_1266536 [Mycena sp. CBHHK59/15]|nr:hypothetical protein B0H10DRAFT_1266536 [Mycena sp. CBHHK59/15]
MYSGTASASDVGGAKPASDRGEKGGCAGAKSTGEGGEKGWACAQGEKGTKAEVGDGGENDSCAANAGSGGNVGGGSAVRSGTSVRSKDSMYGNTTAGVARSGPGADSGCLSGRSALAVWPSSGEKGAKTAASSCTRAAAGDAVHAALYASHTSCVCVLLSRVSVPAASSSAAAICEPAERTTTPSNVSRRATRVSV